MQIPFDMDEWEQVVETSPTSASMSWRRRLPEEVAAIKARTLREREDRILAEAEAIRLRRAQAGDHSASKEG
jgi:hypothetical protein